MGAKLEPGFLVTSDLGFNLRMDVIDDWRCRIRCFFLTAAEEVILLCSDAVDVDVDVNVDGDEFLPFRRR